jgi:hypothetical protein
MPEPAPHKCPGGCGVDVVHNKLACPLDWARLPQELKDQVLAAWKRRNVDKMAHLQAVARAMSWYRRNPRRPLPNAPTFGWPTPGPRPNRHESLYLKPAPKPAEDGQ